MKGTARPSLAALLLAGAFSWAFFGSLVVQDFGMHLRVGEWVLTRHSVPREEFLTFTAAGHPWITQQWLSGAIFAAVYRAGGLTALFWLLAIAFAGTLWLLWRAGRESGAEPLALGLLVALEWAALGFHAGFRGSLFSHLLVAAFLVIAANVQREPARARLLWAFPPLLFLWISLHGMFIVGVALELLVLAQWALATKRFAYAAAVAGVTLALLLAAPFHLDGLLLPFRYFGGDASRVLRAHIDEWQGLDPATPLAALWLVWMAIAAATIAAAARARKRPLTWPQLLLGTAFLVLTVRSKRHLPLGAMLLLPPVCEVLLAPLAKRYSADPGRLGSYSRMEGEPRSPLGWAIPFAAAALLMFAGSRGPAFQRSKLPSSRCPAQAIAALHALPPGRLFGDYNWAGMTAWLAPAWPQFIQPDVTAYPPSLLDDWYRVANTGDGWRDTLDHWQVDTILMPSNTKIVAALAADPDWTVAYRDPIATVLRKK
jgi:hypothetical protein